MTKFAFTQGPHEGEEPVYSSGEIFGLSDDPGYASLILDSINFRRSQADAKFPDKELVAFRDLESAGLLKIVSHVSDHDPVEDESVENVEY